MGTFNNNNDLGEIIGKPKKKKGRKPEEMTLFDIPLSSNRTGSIISPMKS